MKHTQVNSCVRAAADGGAGRALHKGTIYITDIKDLCTYCDNIPVDGSTFRKRVLKSAMAPYGPQEP